ncbi:2244_t:CDS:2 [Funneliformis geosporum]|uniref:2244_t:CDS:1 n=1 Tax=Funneliformis geosporum TaxID=1117311 RepID=A0A9W4SSM8_9GLOM|nr:2244_t:CDS:2 [Funneliformis geosporum]
MSTELWELSSKEYINALESGEFSDIELLVGEESNAKVFKAHSVILKIRSPYFRTALSNDWLKKEKNVIKFQKPNISVEIFEIILKYIYSSVIELSHNDIKTNIAILIAADELCLNDLCIYIEEYLLGNDNKSLLKQNFVLIQDVATRFTQFCKLVKFYKINIQQDPSLIFKADDFVTIKQEILLDILVKNNHSVKPIEIWDKLMAWSIAQSNELPSDITKWTHKEVSIFGKVIKLFIPHINFKEISPVDFVQKVKPFKNSFEMGFYVQILEHYSFNDNDSKTIDSKIINSDQAFLIGSAIKITKQGKYNSTYNFKLLVRGSRNGFEVVIFHSLCDVVNEKQAIYVSNSYGPEFGNNKADLRLLYTYKKGQCFKNSYENLIRKNEGEFEIEDYEVFQVIERST